MLAAIDRSGPELRPWDVVVVTHKVVSKAEGRLVDLDTVSPSAALSTASTISLRRASLDR